MIDTVRYKQFRRYSYPISLRDASVAPGSIPDFHVHRAGWAKYVVRHEKTCLRTVFCANEPVKIEVSLSRVLFGHNGCLISRQTDITNALKKVDELLDKVSQCANPQRTFKRVDLVWQFKGDPAVFAGAHSNCRHPMIHTPTADHGNNGLEWKGSQIKILMYDKLLKQNRRLGNVVRLEVQFRGRPLTKLLGKGSPVTDLDFHNVIRRTEISYRSLTLNRFLRYGIQLI